MSLFPLISLCGIELEPEAEAPLWLDDAPLWPAEAPLWPLVEGVELWDEELEGEVDWDDEGEVALWPLELLGLVLCELLEDDGLVVLWSDWGREELELLLEGDVLWELLDGDALCELLLEGEVLCELLLDDGVVALWSDCGIADEFELLLDGLLDDELLVEELPLTDGLDWLLDDGAWLLEEGNWSELCGWAAVGFCAGLCWAAGVCVWSGKVFGVVGACVAVLWASAKPALIASTIPSLYRFFFIRFLPLMCWVF
jgi:hypothetical protein